MKDLIARSQYQKNIVPSEETHPPPMVLLDAGGGFLLSDLAETVRYYSRGISHLVADLAIGVDCCVSFGDELKQSIRQIHVQGFQNLVLFQGRTGILKHQISHAQVVVRLSKIWLDAYRLLAGFHRFIVPTKFAISQAQVVVRVG